VTDPLPERTEMTAPTARQLKAWPKYVAEAQKYFDTYTLPTDLTSWEWNIDWAEEARPGRGSNLSATYLGAEYAVQIMLDVYGSGSMSVAETTWVHSSADEDCTCKHCEEEREKERPRPDAGVPALIATNTL
jgi:hypothetical protein